MVIGRITRLIVNSDKSINNLIAKNNHKNNHNKE